MWAIYWPAVWVIYQPGHLHAVYLLIISQDHNPKFPLLIDPDGIGYTRIQEVEYNNKLVTIDMSNRYLSVFLTPFGFSGAVIQFDLPISDTFSSPTNSESRALASLGRALTLGLPTVLLNIGTDLPSVIYPIFDQRRHLDGDGKYCVFLNNSE